MQVDQAAIYAERKRILLEAKKFISQIYYQSVFFNTKKELHLLLHVTKGHINSLVEVKNQIGSEKFREPYQEAIKKLRGIQSVIVKQIYSTPKPDDPKVIITFIKAE